MRVRDIRVVGLRGGTVEGGRHEADSLTMGWYLKGPKNRLAESEPTAKGTVRCVGLKRNK